MKYYSESITNLIEELASLPNIGPKSAQRLALPILTRETFSGQYIDGKAEDLFLQRMF